MDVLQEVLEWSEPRPAWQRDALRRMLTQGNLRESDLEELTAQCKSAHGLAERSESVPLESKHIPSRGVELDTTRLMDVIHHGGVNALASDQTISFGSGLTVVYGANATGKSGFTRILKRACRARGAEEILGNVLVESAPGRPSATIRFEAGGKKHELAWKDQETHEALGRVSVFDSHSAGVYIREKTDVAFRPFGLDLFDRLSDACETIRKVLEKERKELATLELDLPDLPAGTSAHGLVSSITSLTDPDEVRKLATLPVAEKDRLQEIRRRLRDLEAANPSKTARSLILRADRLASLVSRLMSLDRALAEGAVRQLFEARDGVERARTSAEALQESTFPLGLLAGTGSEIWRELWEAARQFSTRSAYPDHVFPFTGHGARCLLCQQGIDEAAALRLKGFEAFLLSAAQQQLDEARATYDEQRGRLEGLVVDDEVTHGALQELKIEAEQLADDVEGGLRQTDAGRSNALRALRADQPPPSETPLQGQQAKAVSAVERALRERAAQVLQDAEQETKTGLSRELTELQAREQLGEGLKAVLDDIERKKKLAAYQVCLQDTNTTGITRKSTDVTTRAVTQRLAAGFSEELRRLRFTHLEVEVQEAGGVRGALYHKLVLKRAIGVDLPRVVSEGEARCLSIAAFFAELSTASERSAILFDDPVSSLDHEWRENVARRLAEEARARQVVVFTHDVVFLVALVRLAKEVGAQCDHQQLRREAIGPGVSSPELPWIAMKVGDRIGVLRNLWQRAEKLYRTSARDEYEQKAAFIYGKLREAWERGLEEVLLGGVIERYRHSVETRQAKVLPDITKPDCDSFEAGMTKCSRWLPGHDQAPADNAPMPEPDEIKQDISALETWVTTIRKRRGK